MNKKANKKGFTIMEMLIVVAIIAVLVAIAIPTFNGALTKAKEATDVANIRAGYAELQVALLTEDGVNIPESDEAFLATYLDSDLNYPTHFNYAKTPTDATGAAIKGATLTYTPDKLKTDAMKGDAYTWVIGTSDIK